MPGTDPPANKRPSGGGDRCVRCVRLLLPPTWPLTQTTREDHNVPDSNFDGMVAGFLRYCAASGWRDYAERMLAADCGVARASFSTSYRAATPTRCGSDWVMNTTVLPPVSAPNVTSRVVALVNQSRYSTPSTASSRARLAAIQTDAPHRASRSAAADSSATVDALATYSRTQSGAALPTR